MKDLLATLSIIQKGRNLHQADYLPGAFAGPGPVSSNGDYPGLKNSS